MGNLLKHLNEAKRLINENLEENPLDEAREDRRGQVIDYLIKNPGATIADIGRAIWGRDIATLGRDSTQVITIVRTIASAFKAGAIGRDDRKKPHKYYAKSDSGKLIGAPEELGGSPVKRAAAKGVRTKPLVGKRFNGPEIESKINALASKGYIVKKQRSEPDGTWYYKIQEPKNVGTDIGTGIGYRAEDSKTGAPNTDYFYHNSHGSDDNKLGNVWNHSNSGTPGPGGWYTFDQNYVENIINKLASKTPEQAPKPEKKSSTKVTPEQYLEIFNKEWSSRGQWQGGPKYFDLETGERGPRTDHGGGEDGEDWMDSEQVEQLRQPYVRKWMPILKDFQARLAKRGIKTEEPYVDYGEKGHVSLQLTVK